MIVVCVCLLKVVDFLEQALNSVICVLICFGVVFEFVLLSNSHPVYDFVTIGDFINTVLVLRNILNLASYLVSLRTIQIFEKFTVFFVKLCLCCVTLSLFLLSLCCLLLPVVFRFLLFHSAEFSCFRRFFNALGLFLLNAFLLLLKGLLSLSFFLLPLMFGCGLALGLLPFLRSEFGLLGHRAHFSLWLLTLLICQHHLLFPSRFIT